MAKMGSSPHIGRSRLTDNRWRRDFRRHEPGAPLRAKWSWVKGPGRRYRRPVLVLTAVQSGYFQAVRLFAVLAVLFAAALFTSSASAVTCSYSASDYSTAAPFDVSSPGSQRVTDPVFPDQWGLTQINAPAAWGRGDRGAGVTIAIVDTGIDLVHPDLAANLAPGTDLTPAAAQGCPGPQDENGHGTHVAGIAAAVTGNGIGGAGTAPLAKVMPVRVLDADGNGDDPVVVQGIKYAADHGAKVINLSLGGQPIIGEARRSTRRSPTRCSTRTPRARSWW